MDLLDKKVEASTRCRVCLEKNEEMHSLLAEVVHVGKIVACKELLKRLANVEISMIINAPMGICAKCKQELLMADKLVAKIRDAEKYWWNLFEESLKDPLECEIKMVPLEKQEAVTTKKELLQKKNLEEKSVLTTSQSHVAVSTIVEIPDTTSDSLTMDTAAVDDVFNLPHEKEMEIESFDLNETFDAATTDSESDYWAPYWSQSSPKQNAAENDTKNDTKDEENLATAKPFVCTHCSKRFPKNWNLTMHLKVIHKIKMKEPKSFSCSHCPRIFLRKHYLKSHLRQYHKDIQQPAIDYARIYGRHLCQYCGKMIRHLEVHIRRHEDYKPFQCQHCDIAFVEYSNLEEHERIHSGEKPFKCEVCGKCFSARSYRKRHMLTHTKEKPYKCKLCDKGFGQPTGLKSHMNAQHSGTRPFICQVCNEEFDTYASLQLHRKQLKHSDNNSRDIFASIRVGQNLRRWKS